MALGKQFRQMSGVQSVQAIREARRPAGKLNCEHVESCVTVTSGSLCEPVHIDRFNPTIQWRHTRYLSSIASLLSENVNCPRNDRQEAEIRVSTCRALSGHTAFAYNAVAGIKYLTFRKRTSATRPKTVIGIVYDSRSR